MEGLGHLKVVWLKHCSLITPVIEYLHLFLRQRQSHSVVYLDVSGIGCASRPEIESPMSAVSAGPDARNCTSISCATGLADFVLALQFVHRNSRDVEPLNTVGNSYLNYIYL